MRQYFLPFLLITVHLAACAPAKLPPSGSTGQVELREAAPLLDKDGRLTRLGWARRETLQYNPEKVALPARRLREWEFFTVLTPGYAINFTIADIGFAALCTVDTVDFATQKAKMGAVIKIGARPRILIGRTSHGTAACKLDGKTVLEFQTFDDRREVTFDIPAGLFSEAMRGKFTFQQNADFEYLAIATPFADPREFFYEQKIPGMPAEGVVWAGGEEIRFARGQSFAVMDWGRGTWPESLMWRWGAAAGVVDGHTIAFNLGNGFGDDSAATENLVTVDGKAHKLHRVNWQYDTADYKKPWTFKDDEGRFELQFVPIYQQKVDANLLVKAVKLHKLYGHFSGRIVLDDGKVLAIENMLGFGEEMFVRW